MAKNAVNSDFQVVRGDAVHELIRDDIISGLWRPGERLQTKPIADRYQASTTVVREALTRLAGESFVRFEFNKGFFVPTLSLDELRDLTEVRCVNEGLAIKLAIERGDMIWESQVVAAHHQLRRVPRRLADDPHHLNEAWNEAHAAFHAKLLEACRVLALTNIARQLSAATDLYRRWAAPSQQAESRDVESEHAAILEAVIDRDTEKAQKLLCMHYTTSAEVIIASGLVEDAHVE